MLRFFRFSSLNDLYSFRYLLFIMHIVVYHIIIINILWMANRHCVRSVTYVFTTTFWLNFDFYAYYKTTYVYFNKRLINWHSHLKKWTPCTNMRCMCNKMCSCCLFFCKFTFCTFMNRREVQRPLYCRQSWQEQGLALHYKMTYNKEGAGNYNKTQKT